MKFLKFVGKRDPGLDHNRRMKKLSTLDKPEAKTKQGIFFPDCDDF